MIERTIPFEELIKKRDNDRCYPSCEQELEPNKLLLFLCALAKHTKAALCFIGIVLQAIISTCVSIVKFILCLMALLLLLAVL